MAARGRWGGLLLGLMLAGPSPAGERLVTLAPHLAELVCAVDAAGCPQLVGVVAWSDFPAAVRDKPVVGDAFAVNAEAVLALRPTRVLSWAGGTSEATRQALLRLGLRVEPVQAQSLARIPLALRELGVALDRAAAGEAAARQFEQTLETLRARHAGRPPVRVLYQLEAEPLFAIGRDSPIHEAMGVCGAVNVFADLDAAAAPVAREAAVAAAPELILFGRRDDGPAIRARWAPFAAVPAVRHGQLQAVDEDRLARYGPRLVEGIAELCARVEAVRAAQPERRQPTSSPPAPRSSTRAATNR